MRPKKVIIAALCLATLAALERLHSFQNGGFTPSKLISYLPSTSAPPPPEIDSLLDQSFRFLGKGGTSFVFLGEDGKTVLKLFKHQHLTYKSFLRKVAFPGTADAMRIKKLLSGQKKNAHKGQDFFFNSCRLAYDELREETGLIYLCLQPNSHFARSVELIDSWGIRYTIDLSRTEFAIQKKTELFFPHLDSLHLQGRTEEIKHTIDAFLLNVVRRCQKGIGDRDPNLLINFGCIDGIVVEFDLGSYYLNPELANPLQTSKELYFSSYALQKWLEKHSPDLLDYLLDRICKVAQQNEILP